MPGDGKLVVSVGSSRSGKSFWVRKQIAKSKRILVWDVKDEYARPWDKKNDQPNRTKVLRGWIITRTKSELIKALTDKQKGNFKICHSTDDLSQFDYWARCAYAFGKVVEMDIIAEELADVTTPAKAPEGWGMVCRKILGYGCNVYAVTQRPAESDKTSFGNNSMIHCGRLARHKDRKYMADEMDLDLQIIKDLKPREWVERYANGDFKEGKV